MKTMHAALGVCVVLSLAACGEAKLRSPQQSDPADAASSPPPAQTPEPVDAQVAVARDAAPPPLRPRETDASSPPRDAMTQAAEDAGKAAPVREPQEDDAGALVDASQPSEPVACASDRALLEAAACASEGEVCSHWSTDPNSGYDSYFACLCIAASSARLVWNCYETLTGSVQCPHELPASGSSCNGHKSQTCPYPPRVSCECPVEGANPRWRCMEPERAPEAPVSLPANTPVRDLDDAARHAFCDWYVGQQVEDGFPQPPEPQPTPDGYLPSDGCRGCGGGVGFGGMSPWPLPVSACVANLGLSTCQQPLSELIDCVRSMWSECWPTPHGCARYLESPGCAGTLVVKVGSSLPVDCRIKIR
jgi:hypothetical protein